MLPPVAALLRDRRLAVRHLVKVPIRLHIRRAANASEHRCESENLSRRGVFFRTDLRLTEGAIVDLLLEMPEEITEVPAATWLCTGRIVRVVPMTPRRGMLGVAVKFDFYEISRSQKSLWAMGSGIRGPVTPKSESQAAARVA